MIHAEDAGVGRGGRRRRSVSEKLEIVQLTMEPGASVAEVARARGVNANQVFKWRRLFENGRLRQEGASPTALLPVTIAAGAERASKPPDLQVHEQTASSSAVHIEFPGQAMIWIESGTDPALVRCVLESLRK